MEPCKWYLRISFVLKVMVEMSLIGFPGKKASDFSKRRYVPN